MTRNRMFLIAACLFVGLGLTLGFLDTGDPHRQRMINADFERVRDMELLGASIQSYYYVHKELPASLAQVDLSRIRDPETHHLFEYLPGQAPHFQLCAVFQTDNRADQAGEPRRVHPAGRKCFDY